jgi:hypothetical protein
MSALSAVPDNNSGRTQSGSKPIKLRMKFAYHKEQADSHRREQAVDNAADGSDIPPDIEDRLSSAEGQERPLQSRQAQLQKHQWRLHRRRDCNDPAASTTITMQDIINHGVEKSLREMPVCHSKTSSKYYSEVLGLEYSGAEDSSSSIWSSSNVQPLDLSSAKKATALESSIRHDHSRLSNQPPLPRSPRPCDQVLAAGRSAPLSLSTPPSLPTPPESFPALKKPRMDAMSGASPSSAQASTHQAPPPISTLQNPPPVTLPTARNPESSVAYRHSSWIRESLRTLPADLPAAKKPAAAAPAARWQGQWSRLLDQSGRAV